jgi:hypothetical protein
MVEFVYFFDLLLEGEMKDRSQRNDEAKIKRMNWLSTKLELPK